MPVTPLVLQVYFWDHTGSLDNPNMDTWSGTTHYHSDLRNATTVQNGSPINHISITRPLYQ